MKKLIFITMAIIAIFTTSCDEDTETADNLAGTTWRANNTEGTASVELRFKSSSNVDLFDYLDDGGVESLSGKYSVSDNIMTANFLIEDEDEEEGFILKGRIDGKKMTVELWEIGDDEPEDTVIFLKL